MLLVNEYLYITVYTCIFSRDPWHTRSGLFRGIIAQEVRHIIVYCKNEQDLLEFRVETSVLSILTTCTMGFS